MQKTSKSGLFLLEMLIIIVFFAATSAICVRLFVYSAQLSDRSSALTEAMVRAQSAAEAVKAAEGDETLLESLLHGDWENGVLRVFYNQDFQALPDDEDAQYILTVEQDLDGSGLLAATVTVAKENGETICTLPVGKYTGSAEGGEPA